MATGIARLPDAVLGHVWSYVDAFATFRQLAPVCRGWSHHLAPQDYLGSRTGTGTCTCTCFRACFAHLRLWRDAPWPAIDTWGGWRLAWLLRAVAPVLQTLTLDGSHPDFCASVLDVLPNVATPKLVALSARACGTSLCMRGALNAIVAKRETLRFAHLLDLQAARGHEQLRRMVSAQRVLAEFRPRMPATLLLVAGDGTQQQAACAVHGPLAWHLGCVRCETLHCRACLNALPDPRQRVVHCRACLDVFCTGCHTGPCAPGARLALHIARAKKGT